MPVASIRLADQAPDSFLAGVAWAGHYRQADVMSSPIRSPAVPVPELGAITPCATNPHLCSREVAKIKPQVKGGLRR